MDSQELRNLQEAYLEVYSELDEDKRPIYGRGGAIRKTETPLQIYGNQATANDKRTKHNIPKGGTTIDKRDPDELFSGDYDRGSGNAAKRRAAALTKPEAKKFPNRLTRSDKQGIKDSFDLYDIILSHLLDEGYAETVESAEAIMVNMSEDWRESICEEYDMYEELTGERRKRAIKLGYKKLATGREGSRTTQNIDYNLPTNRGGSGVRRNPNWSKPGQSLGAVKVDVTGKKESDRGIGNKAARRAGRDFSKGKAAAPWPIIFE